MKNIKTTLSMMLASSLFCSMAIANPDVPQNITTPDLVKTKTLGSLHFKDGYPSDETMSKVQRYMLVQRAVNVFVDGIPISSL